MTEMKVFVRPMPEERIDEEIKNTKALRRDLDSCLQGMRATLAGSREVSLAITKTQEAIMWLGLNLKELNGGVSCYKHGYDPSNAEVEPVADGVKF